jgi:hypothetical protein
MGALCLPSGVTHGVHYPFTGNVSAAWTACQRRRQGLPPVSGTMGQVLGCMYSCIEQRTGWRYEDVTTHEAYSGTEIHPV